MEPNRKRSFDVKQENVVHPEQNRKKSLFSLDVRRERLDYILELFKQNPTLADTSYSRLPSLIEKRNRLWELITEKVNKKFAVKLEEITVEQVKKNMLYVKKREEGSYDNIKDMVIPDRTEYPSIRTPRHPGLSNENVKTTFKNELREPDDSENEYPYSVNKLSLTPEHQNRLTKLLNDGSHTNNTPNTPIKKDRKIAKERAAYITEQADYYLKRLCLDTTARSMAVNVERNNMWIKIMKKVNEEFKDRLPPIGLEQAKKQYSNYKMRDRPKSEVASFDMFEETQSTKSNSRRTSRSHTNSPFLKTEHMELISPGDHPLGDISIQPQMDSLEQLRMKLKQKEAQVESLKKKVAEQAKDYADRISIIMDMVKTVVSKSTKEDIARMLA